MENSILKKIEEIDKKIFSLKEERRVLESQNTGYFVGVYYEVDGEIITRILMPLSYGTETQAINWAKENDAEYYMISKEDYHEFNGLCRMRIALKVLPPDYPSHGRTEELLSDHHVQVALGCVIHDIEKELKNKYEWLNDDAGCDIVEYKLWDGHLSEYRKENSNRK